MTHASVPPNAVRRIGITDGLVRISAGIEDIEDLRRPTCARRAGKGLGFVQSCPAATPHTASLPPESNHEELRDLIGVKGAQSGFERRHAFGDGLDHQLPLGWRSRPAQPSGRWTASRQGH